VPPRKILAIKLRALGDTVLMTAPLAELRAAYPAAEIHALVLKPWASLLEHDPAVDRIHTYVRHPEPAARAKALARVALTLRREHYDCVVCFHAGPSSSMLAFATGAPVRSVHFHGHKDKNRHSTVTVPGKGQLKPAIERDMDAVRALGLHVPAGRLPRLALQSVEKDWARARLAQSRMSAPVLALGLGSSRPTKSWPVERFAALAVGWCKARPAGSALAIAGPGEEAKVHAFLRAIDDLLSATEPDVAARAAIRSRIAAESRLSIRQVAAVLSQVAVLAGNDSGPRHLAVAVGTPTVTLFGPEHPFEWHPYPTAEHPYFFIDSLACRRDADPGMPAWCGLHECVAEANRCMTLIGVDAVLAKASEVARKPPTQGTTP
jgi:ADP-heptose:LPS heptosyltransferase